jgi:hypothetical protein
MGERLPDWAYLELADLDTGVDDAKLMSVSTRWLLIRRNIADGELTFFTT